MSDPTSDAPKPVEGLDVHEVDDGLVVYDGAKDRVHYLNASAALVFTLCDGTRSVADIDALVREVWTSTPRPPTA
ncbi:MAG: PqqD family peptide modification chaperone [Acidimicrobiia bacterium]